ncbi:hypothetical protein LIER_41306 [Lithospermum erythrorhizon]|uniref:Integrase catalytic domain-containing protein n=1 Tax=Lithospermum erythrorhizon TaxID=34254 RepID=A0AAV3R982_LITER
MYEGELYRKSFEGPLLLFVSQENITKVLYEVHNGCRPFSEMRGVPEAGKCPSAIPDMMTPIIYPVPFIIWGIDLVGKLPKAKGSAEYVVVAVDYFRKWVEAAPLAKIKGEDIVRFLWKPVLTRFGIPRILASDNGAQFDSSMNFARSMA